MKKTLLIAMLLIPFLGFSQTTKPIDGFLGIKFGSTKEEVTAAIQAKGGTLIKSDDVNKLLFRQVTLGHRTSIVMAVKFIDGKAYAAQFLFKAEFDSKTIDYYNSFVDDLSQVYGQGKAVKNFKNSYEDGDGHELLAIESGNANYYTYWEAANKNDISIQISTVTTDIENSLRVTLFYTDDELNTKAKEAEKAKEKSDY